MQKRYVVRLAEEEREALTAMINRGRSSAKRLKRANILLKADADGPNWTDVRIADAFGSSDNTVRNIRKRFVEEGFEAALERKKYDKTPVIMDGEKEAHLIALACSDPPEGRARWTLRLLAEKFVELEIGVPISYETVRQTLKKMNLSLT